MSDCMKFPDTWDEFEKLYGFDDRKEVYTNGSRLISSFRVEQWLEHIQNKSNNEIRPNPWHTGTPTEEGWYVCKLKNSDLYETHYFTGSNWAEELFEKWQKIDQ